MYLGERGQELWCFTDSLMISRAGSPSALPSPGAVALPGRHPRALLCDAVVPRPCAPGMGMELVTLASGEEERDEGLGSGGRALDEQKCILSPAA